MTSDALSVQSVLVERPSRAVVDCERDEIVDAAAQLLGGGYRLALVSARHEGAVIELVYLFVAGPPDQRVELRVRLDARAPFVPSIAHLSYPASRFEREMHDLFGVASSCTSTGPPGGTPCAPTRDDNRP